MCQTARRRMEGLWREGCERIESCQERWRGRKRKGTMLDKIKDSQEIMKMTMTVEDVERTRCVLLRALRELIIEDCQIARLKIQIQNIPISIHHCKTSAFSIDSSHPVLETFEAHRLPFKQ